MYYYKMVSNIKTLLKKNFIIMRLQLTQLHTAVLVELSVSCLDHLMKDC